MSCTGLPPFRLWIRSLWQILQTRKPIPGRNTDVGAAQPKRQLQRQSLGLARWGKGKFVEDESYEWSDAENERRLGVRVRETKYFILFREIRYKQREHNYWIERAGGWRIKIPFCKTYEQTRIANWFVVDFPIFILCLWRMFSEHPIR